MWVIFQVRDSGYSLYFFLKNQIQRICAYILGGNAKREILVKAEEKFHKKECNEQKIEVELFCIMWSNLV
jgi:hypothetical protein